MIVSLLAPSTGSLVFFVCGWWLLDMRSQQETHVIAFFENKLIRGATSQRLAPTIFGSQWQSFGARSSPVLRLTLHSELKKVSKSAVVETILEVAPDSVLLY